MQISSSKVISTWKNSKKKHKGAFVLGNQNVSPGLAFPGIY